MMKLSKKAQKEHEAWNNRVATEGITVGRQILATRVTTNSRDYIVNQWSEPAEVVEIRHFDALVKFHDGTISSSGLGFTVQDV